MRNMGWLLGKDKTEGDEKGESSRISEAGRVLTLLCVTGTHKWLIYQGPELESFA